MTGNQSKAWWLVLPLLLAAVSVAAATSGPVDLAAKRDEMRSLLSRGAAADAVRLGLSVPAAGGQQDELEAEIFRLQIQGYLQLGLPQVAVGLIRERLSGLAAGATAEQARLLVLLGQAAISGGRIDVAEEAVDKALSAAKDRPPVERAWPLLLKANIRYLQKKNSEALKLCREAVDLASAVQEPQFQAFAQLQLARIARQSGDVRLARESYLAAYGRYRELGSSRDTVYGIIAVADGLARLVASNSDERRKNLDSAGAALHLASDLAGKLGDNRALSRSFGKQGEVEAADGKLAEGLTATLRALHQAQQARLGDLVYLWQHQAGSILKKQGETGRALEMYRLAAENLALFKKGLANECGIADGSFRETSKPVYQDLAELLIDTAGQADRQQLAQSLLREAQATIELLRTEELRDYFEDACLGADRSNKISLADVPPKTALIYAIMLPSRTELLVTFPDGIKRYRTTESTATIGREIRLLRMTIENRFPAWSTSARKLYDWLIRPLEADLKAHQVTTLVFVPDGPLRNIPLSVLHDGEGSLIDKYAIATIQSLNFTTPPGAGRPGTMMMAGISESVQGYPALANVIQEEKGIRASFGGISLINSEFRVQNVKEQLDLIPYPLIHIASHGEFTGNSRNNYVLTWDGRLTLNDLDQFIRSSVIRKTPVELISLSACKTAAGDDRASLGLAGLAVKSGARTAVASLWDIDDKSTAELFIEFYQIVKERGGIGRAESLRQAQLAIKKRYDHPYFWSPFLLIGNWL